MSAELQWLLLSLLMTALFWFPYVLNRIAVLGLGPSLGNPRADAKPLADWAQRAKLAHANAVENLVLFAPAALAVHLLGRGDGLSASACAIYFVARLVHFLAYSFGIPGLRTLAFFAGWCATLALILRALGWA